MKLGKNIFGAVLAAALCGTAVIGTTAEARPLRFAIGHPPNSDSHKAGQVYAEALKEYSGGALTARVFPLSLLSAAETSAGVRDGIADIGFLLTPYFPAEYPHTNLIADSSMLLRLLDGNIRGKENMAYVGAMAEYMFFHCPECNAEFGRQNQVFTGNAASSSYGLHCTVPVKSEADLRGKRMRASGSQWSRWAAYVGATPVTISVNESLEALSQGVIDCDINSAPELINFGLIDAVKHTTMGVPAGIFAGVAGTNVNADTWRKLGTEERRALLRAGAVFAAEATYNYRQREEEALAAAKKKGIGLHEPDAALVEKTQAFIESDLKTIAAHYAKTYGVKDGEQRLAAFQQILQRWIELVQPVESREALAELYWTEVFSKVDPDKHGM